MAMGSDGTKQSVLDRLERLALKYDLEFDKEYHVRDSRSTVDAVWLKKLPIGNIPVAAFKIEASKHSTKHSKGNSFNMNWPGVGLKVIVLVGKGVGLYARPEQLLQDTHSDVRLWTEKDLADQLGDQVGISKFLKTE